MIAGIAKQYAPPSLLRGLNLTAALEMAASWRARQGYQLDWGLLRVYLSKDAALMFQSKRTTEKRSRRKRSVQLPFVQT